MPGSPASSHGGSQALTTLFSSVLAGAAATIDTGAAGVAASATHLLIVLSLRSNKAATTDSVSLTFNADGTASYYTESLEGFGITANAVESLAAASINLENCPAATSTADVFSPMTLLVPDYAGGHKKSLNGLAGYRTGNATGNVLSKALIGFWDNVAAISRVTVTTTAQFVVGSSMHIYGLV